VSVSRDGSDHGSGDEDCGLDPIDFRADEFVSAMDKLLLGKVQFHAVLLIFYVNVSW